MRFGIPMLYLYVRYGHYKRFAYRYEYGYFTYSYLAILRVKDATNRVHQSHLTVHHRNLLPIFVFPLFVCDTFPFFKTREQLSIGLELRSLIPSLTKEEENVNFTIDISDLVLLIFHLICHVHLLFRTTIVWPVKNLFLDCPRKNFQEAVGIRMGMNAATLAFVPAENH